MMLAVFAFFSQISDPRFGGTYMTLFNTTFFVGWLIPNTIILKMVSILTFNNKSKGVVNCSLIDVRPFHFLFSSIELPFYRYLHIGI